MVSFDPGYLYVVKADFQTESREGHAHDFHNGYSPINQQTCITGGISCSARDIQDILPWRVRGGQVVQPTRKSALYANLLFSFSAASWPCLSFDGGMWGRGAWLLPSSWTLCLVSGKDVVDT